MNWRGHPEAQKKLLSAVMSEVGWAGALLFNEVTGRLIDGHARRRGLERADAEMDPEKKAELVVLVYQYLNATGEKSEEAVQRFLRVAK